MHKIHSLFADGFPELEQRYVREREGETAWTMDIDDSTRRPVGEVPAEVTAQVTDRENTRRVFEIPKFDPGARAWDEDSALPPNYNPPSLDE